MKILFLDIDGPLISSRAAFLPGNRGKLLTWFDPVATALLLDVLQETGAKIVISSTWGKHGIDECQELFAKNGIDWKAYVHEDWVTPKKWSSQREEEIRWWLDKHPEVKKFAILDDGHVSFANFVRTTTVTGLELHHRAKLLKLLGEENATT